MRVMVIVKATPGSEAGRMPTEQLIRDMGNFNEELLKAGLLEMGEGLHPSSRGVRLHLTSDSRTVERGPFSETHELVSGFWIWKVSSLEEAISWANRCPQPMPGEDSILELRPILAPEDFGDAFTKELQEQEQRLRNAIQ